MKKYKKNMTKIFCDTADLKEIKRFNSNKLVHGFTTNPSLMRKAGAKNYEMYSKKILKICKYKPVSLEVFADEFDLMKKQALKINSWGKNVYVKIPVTNTKGKFSGKLIKYLSKKKIKLNITAVYNIDQVKKIIKCLDKKSNTIISIFCGRMADYGKDPIPIIKESVNISKKFKKIKILWASTREAYNFTQAKKYECDIITMPTNVIEQIKNFGKLTLNGLTLKTVKTFYSDASKAKFKI